MSKKRRNHSAKFKSQVAIAAIKGDLTVAEISVKYSIAQSLVGKWKKAALESLPDVFSDKSSIHTGTQHEHEIKELNAKIGELLVEKDFLLKAFGN